MEAAIKKILTQLESKGLRPLDYFIDHELFSAEILVQRTSASYYKTGADFRRLSNLLGDLVDFRVTIVCLDCPPD